MKVNANQRLDVENNDGLEFRFVRSPNTEAGSMALKYLVIHGTEGQSVAGAIAHFSNPDTHRSVHLVLGRDGKDLVQMVDFNTRAQHASEYNRKSLGIELDYTGPLTEKPGLEQHFTHVSHFQPGDYIYGVALNDRGMIPTRLRPWPRFSQVQMDSLVRIARLLVAQFGLEITGHEEIKSEKSDPGPAFPMRRFKDIVNGIVEGSVLFDETSQELELRTGPGMVYPLLPGGRLSAGTPVSVTLEHDGWGLVEVMAEVQGNPWLVGWTRLETITARQGTPVVMGHKLFTTDGRQYQYVAPHANNFDANRKLIEPRYIIIHTTDGIAVESTINTFTNEKSGVSAHLLVGRDGRVVQFVDFDTVAYHCGYSYWEEDFDLNRYSIGIELDNGGSLSHTDGVWKWKTTIIPDEEVTEAQHWKEFKKRGWHRFTDVQLAVAKEIVLALQAKYGMRILLTHDVINLPERADPGPLFPLEDFRQALSGQPGVFIKVYKPVDNRNIDIYKNPKQNPPDLDQPRLSGTLPLKTKVSIQDVKGDWTLVKVVGESGPFKGTTGWIRSRAVNSAQKKPKTSQDSPYYKVFPAAPGQPPPSLLDQSPLPAGAPVRIDRIVGDWALVAALETVKGHTCLEGWVKHAEIALSSAGFLIYPPTFKPDEP